MDAGSTDGSIAYIATLGKNVRLIRQKKRIGQAKSLNKILRRIKSQYVCWLSDDNIIKKGMLDTSVSILEKDSDIGMVGLKVKDIKGPYAHEEYIGGIWPSGVLNVNQGMIRADVLQKIFYFDEKFPDYGMDADLTTKILLAGYKVVYTKKTAIEHSRAYKEFPGAFTNIERSGRLLVALELYKYKYEKLCKSYLRKKLLYFESVSTLHRIYLSHIFGFRRFGFSLEKVTGYKYRDFVNVFEAQFVSNLDLWYNRNKPYYLVQIIPENLRLLFPYEKKNHNHRT